MRADIYQVDITPWYIHDIFSDMIRDMSHLEGQEFEILDRYKEKLSNIIQLNDHRCSEAQDLHNLMMKLVNYVDYLKNLNSLGTATHSFLIRYTLDYINRLKPLVDLIDKK